MTHKELTTKVEDLEALITAGSDYALAETEARELLLLFPLNKGEKGGLNIRVRTLLALTQSLWRRGMAKDGLPYAEEVLALAEQEGSKDLAAKTLNNIGNVYLNLSDYAKALEHYAKALALFEEIGDKVGVATTTGNIGIVYSYLSDYSKVLEYYAKALAAHDELGDKAGAARVTGNIGIVYNDLSDYAKALEYYAKALAALEELGNKSFAARVTSNIGILYNNLSDYAKALEYFTKALAAHEELGNKAGAAIVTGNIGGVYQYLSEYAKALDYYTRALALHEELGNRYAVAVNTGNIGGVYAEEKFEGCDAAKAEEYLLKALSMDEKIGAKKEQYEAHKALADLYKKQKRWEECILHFEKYNEIEKEVQSEEATKKATLIEQQKQIAEREKEIALAKAAAAAKLHATTQLLYKVLPESIATRIIAGEEKIADYYPAVSILFADIVGFTSLASEIPPDVVVDLLNHVFDVFDAIIKRHGCEKVKTIGDGYMAVSGAPEKCEDHAERLARAALDMQKDIALPDEIRSYLPNGTTFSVRIGIHTGSAVCGVMGRERFVWDVYSDAVNTAARMESNGLPGKINVSKDFVWLLRTRQRLTKGVEEFTFIEREEIEIKGKGLMKTYFLEKV